MLIGDLGISIGGSYQKAGSSIFSSNSLRTLKKTSLQYETTKINYLENAGDSEKSLTNIGSLAVSAAYGLEYQAPRKNMDQANFLWRVMQKFNLL